MHNGYAVIKVSSDDKRNSYHHRVNVDIEDLAKVGKIRIAKSGYAYQAVRKGKSMASIIMDTDTNSKMYIDHINGKTLDNRKVNLRVCTPSQNARNRHSFNRNNTGKVGISYRENGAYMYYRVSLTQINGKRKTKQFNVNKLGKEVAFKLANEYLDAEKLKHDYIV